MNAIYEVAAKAAYTNSLELLDEAKILFQHSKFPRAYSLCILSMEEFSIRMLNLDRLGLVELITTGGHRFGGKYYGDSDLDSVGLTRLGRAFVQACRGPKKIKDISTV